MFVNGHWFLTFCNCQLSLTFGCLKRRIKAEGAIRSGSQAAAGCAQRRTNDECDMECGDKSDKSLHSKATRTSNRTQKRTRMGADARGFKSAWVRVHPRLVRRPS